MTHLVIESLWWRVPQDDSPSAYTNSLGEDFFGGEKVTVDDYPPEASSIGTWLPKLADERDIDPARLTEKDYLDAWGHAYRYVRPGLDGKEPFTIYSVGPNGKDEKGKGDDIVATLPR